MKKMYKISLCVASMLLWIWCGGYLMHDSWDAWWSTPLFLTIAVFVAISLFVLLGVVVDNNE